jgi:hypothetical protein
MAVLATDYGAYARKLLKIVFTEEELKNCILPPVKSYLTRQPLDEDRFKIVLGKKFDWITYFIS